MLQVDDGTQTELQKGTAKESDDIVMEGRSHNSGGYRDMYRDLSGCEGGDGALVAAPPAT